MYDKIHYKLKKKKKKKKNVVMINLTMPWYADVWSKIVLDVSVKIFLDDISI